MTTYSWGFIYTTCILAQSPPASPSPPPSSFWSSPLLGPIAGALVTAAVGGIGVALWWKSIDAEVRVLKAEKDKDIAKLDADKRFEIQELKAQFDDKIMRKDFKIQELESEVARLRLENPSSIKEGYEALRANVILLYENTKREKTETENKLAAKENELQALKGKEGNNLNLIEKLQLEKQELLEKQRIFDQFLANLKNFRDRMKVLQSAILWLDTNRKELLDSSVEYVLSNSPGVLGNLEHEEISPLIQRLKDNVDDYIDWLRFSLERGMPVSLSAINLQPEVPGVALARAFEFIRTQRIAPELSDDMADELGAFISDLIAYFSSSAFRP